MAQIRVVKDGQLVKEVPLTVPMTLGRHRNADLQLEDVQLSRLHADIHQHGGDYVITDRRSLNGTVLNGQKLAPEVPTTIESGAVAQLASFQLFFDLEPAKATTPEPPVAVGTPAVESAEAAPSSVSLEAAPAPTELFTDLIQDGNMPIWSRGETELQVVDIIEETYDVKTFRMSGIKPTLFSYKPGQFMTLCVPIDGKEVRRSYTISSSPSRPYTVDITVKRVPGGLVSNWLADNLKLGDRLSARGPSGKFSCFNYPSRKMLLIGAGSGITPVMSMCRWIVDTVADVDVKFLAAFRSPADIIYRRELEWMATRHEGLQVLITLSNPHRYAGAWTGLCGRVDQAMLNWAAPDLDERHVFMCGPEPFMDAVKGHLKALDYNMANFHSEKFGSARVAKDTPVKKETTVRKEAVAPPAPVAPVAETPVAEPAAPPVEPIPAPVETPEPVETPAVEAPAPEPPAPAAPAEEPAAAGSGFAIRFAESEQEVQGDGEVDILELAEAAGVEIDYGCRSGSCRTCIVKCASGDVEVDEDAELEPDERANGMILACVSFPRSDVVIEA